MIIVLILIAFALLALLQIPNLIQKHWWKELICFFALWLMGLILSVMISIGIILPPISTIINKFITRIFY
jgi:hypothetical protein